MADRHIMIQCIDDQSNIFTQIAADIVWSLARSSGILINKVCSKQFIKGSVLRMPASNFSIPSVKSPKVVQI